VGNLIAAKGSNANFDSQIQVFLRIFNQKKQPNHSYFCLLTKLTT